MDEFQYNQLKRTSHNTAELEQYKEKVRKMQSELSVKGEVPVTVRNATRGIKTSFLVKNGKIDSSQLTSKQSLEELGVVQIELNGTFKEKN